MSIAISKGFQSKNDESSQARSTPLLATPTFNHGEPMEMKNNVPVNYSGFTWLAKLDFPRFNGENVGEWLFKAEQIFILDNTPEDLKVRFASFHFDGVAATWYRSIAQSEIYSSVKKDWNQYHQLLVERFGESMVDLIAEWKNLQETDGIVEYHEKFELIQSRVNFPEEFLVSAYLAGLRNDTQMHIRMFQPQSIQHCLFLGRLYEKAHPKNPISTSWTKKRLSPEEMDRRWAQGLCFLCDEKFTPEHYGKHKNAQFFYMTAMDDWEVNNE